MNKRKNDFDHTKNKVAGEVKEAAGKVTDDEQLELKGKMQSGKADLKKKWNARDKAENMKEDAAEKINDRIDRNKKKREN